MRALPTPLIYQNTCHLPRLASDDARNAHLLYLLYACLEPAPVWLHPGPVYPPSELLPPTVAPGYPPEGDAYVQLSSCLRRNREAPFFRSLDRLAIHAPSTRSFFSTVTHSQFGTQYVVDALPHSIGAPLCKVPVDHLPGRQISWQHSPGAASTQQVEYAIGYLSQFVLALSTRICGWWKQRFKPFPLLVCQVARIRWGSHTDSLPHIPASCQCC
jgi:hypothetical protein